MHVLELGDQTAGPLHQRLALVAPAIVRLVHPAQRALAHQFGQPRRGHALVQRRGAGDHRQVDRAPPLDAQPLEQRRRLRRDLVLAVAEVGELGDGGIDAEAPRLDGVAQAPAPEVVPEASQPRQLLLGEALLGLQLVGEHARLEQLALDLRQSLAPGSLEEGQLLLALAVLLLPREFAGELLEAPRRAAPDRPQLEVRQALVAFFRLAQVLLERRELLLDAHRGAFLQLQAVEQALPLVVERVEFLL